MAGGQEFNPQKFKELLLYLARESRRDQGFGMVKLNKLLYACDFEAYRKLGRSITGATYQKLKFGPAAREFLPMQDELLQLEAAQVLRRTRGKYEQKVTIALWEPNLDVFITSELEVVKETLARMADLGGKDASDWSHKESAGWNLVEEGETIPYGTAFISTEPVPDEDVARARELALKRDWVSIRP
jgi:hypothetical protein